MFFVPDLVKFFAALADENRLRLLRLMQDGEVCVCHLQDALQTNQPKVSRHLAYLRKSGVVETRREGKWMYYSLKKLDQGRTAILKEALRLSKIQRQAKHDKTRLKKVCC
jgi:ArsR family transcriptional regulator